MTFLSSLNLGPFGPTYYRKRWESLVNEVENNGFNITLFDIGLKALGQTTLNVPFIGHYLGGTLLIASLMIDIVIISHRHEYFNGLKKFFHETFTPKVDQTKEKVVGKVVATGKEMATDFVVSAVTNSFKK